MKVITREIISAKNLPKNSNEFYQFCYVNAENSICGASIPFQFSSEDPSFERSTLDKSDFDFTFEEVCRRVLNVRNVYV